MMALADLPRWSYQSRRVAATRKLGERLGRLVPPGTAVGLVGDLGMGKTRFVQGFALGMGVDPAAEVVSPTYTLANEYSCERAPMVHMDFYRLTDAESARGLGLEEQLLRPDAICVVEWADRLRDLMPEESVWITFERLSPTERRIRVEGLARPRGLRLVDENP